ncbi:rab-like protein 6 [Microcaecilia unicolor]|uniref:Rab-like protein 6 n=1 Tax=Microcaecilia unicolor TaxID=1415580 RepID=A0A6P7Y5J2_9AMPH|nr:rab-like protein 6 [Microcaecilia unicolor]
MFSALKKLVGSEQSPLRDKNIPAGLQSMNQALQRRFAKGVQYNMKIVIRGDRNTGKSTLWHRLQGKKFIEEYIPTQEIQVTSIHWNYKTTDDIVKVEVWDVVDKGKCKKRGDGLKLENEPQEAESEMALDAEFLDVYKNCNGVVMMFDITKQWTFNYILRELPKVPTHVPVCVLGNHRDMGEHRVILPDDVRECIQNLNRRPGSSYIRYAESSMRNSFGLKYLHKFFNIPFLQLQRETLLRQLETNQLDIDATLEELSVQQETEDQNYELFLEMMECRSRGHASPVASNEQSPSSGSQSPIIPPSSASTESSSPGTPQQPPQQITDGIAASPLSPPSISPGPTVEVPPLLVSPVPASSPPLPVAAPQQKRSIISRLFGSSAPETPPPKPEAVTPSDTLVNVQSVEDFVPDDSLDSSFLEDPTPQKGKKKADCQERPGSDSEGETLVGNLMVAGFQDDLDLDDKVADPSSLLTVHVPSKDIILSSEEEEDSKIIIADESIDSEQQQKWSSKNSLKPQQDVISTKTSNQKPPTSLHSPSKLDKNGISQISASLLDGSSPASVLSASSPAGQAQKAPASSKLSTSKQKEKSRGKADSDSDQEGPIARQMLSFVMDDPDFDSEDSDSATKKVDVFPVREDISDVSEDDMAPVKHPGILKSTIHPFKPKNDLDLFGLGFEEKVPAENSDEEKESKQPSKEKKKKKKSKESQEEDKPGKKKTKHKKSKDKEDSKDDKQKKKKKKSKEKLDEFDELEAFLGGRDGASKARGGEDYEEL